MKNSMDVPQKIKNRTTIKSSNSISGFLPEENKSINSKRYIHPYVHFIIIYNSQDIEGTQNSPILKELCFVFFFPNYFQILGGLKCKLFAH